MPAPCCELWTPVGQGSPDLGPSPCKVPRAPGSVVWPAQGSKALPTLRAAGPMCALTAQSSGLLPATSLLGQRLCLATRGQCSPRWAWVGLRPAGSVRACVRVCVCVCVCVLGVGGPG